MTKKQWEDLKKNYQGYGSVVRINSGRGTGSIGIILDFDDQEHNRPIVFTTTFVGYILSYKSITPYIEPTYMGNMFRYQVCSSAKNIVEPACRINANFGINEYSSKILAQAENIFHWVRSAK